MPPGCERMWHTRQGYISDRQLTTAIKRCTLCCHDRKYYITKCNKLYGILLTQNTAVASSAQTLSNSALVWKVARLVANVRCWTMTVCHMWNTAYRMCAGVCSYCYWITVMFEIYHSEIFFALNMWNDTTLKKYRSTVHISQLYLYSNMGF